jgi:hypothetical protein
MYAVKEFQRESQPWIECDGFTGLYNSSFYPFKAEEEGRAYQEKYL